MGINDTITDLEAYRMIVGRDLNLENLLKSSEEINIPNSSVDDVYLILMKMSKRDINYLRDPNPTLNDFRDLFRKGLDEVFCSGDIEIFRKYIQWIMVKIEKYYFAISKFSEFSKLGDMLLKYNNNKTISDAERGELEKSVLGIFTSCRTQEEAYWGIIRSASYCPLEQYLDTVRVLLLGKHSPTLYSRSPKLDWKDQFGRPKKFISMNLFVNTLSLCRLRDDYKTLSNEIVERIQAEFNEGCIDDVIIRLQLANDFLNPTSNTESLLLDLYEKLDVDSKNKIISDELWEKGMGIIIKYSDVSPFRFHKLKLELSKSSRFRKFYDTSPENREGYCFCIRKID